MDCPKCGSRSYKDGFHDGRQRWQCTVCRSTFYDTYIGRNGRGSANRNRKMPESVRQKISRTLREKKAMGFHIGAPRKNPVYRFKCRICGEMAEDQRGITTRKVCGKKCKIKAANEGRRKLPPDRIIAELYLSGLACTEIAQRFGVLPQSVLMACEREGVPRRKHTVRSHCKEPGCEHRVHQTWHAKLKSWYGTRCEFHLNEYKKAHRKKKCKTDNQTIAT